MCPLQLLLAPLLHQLADRPLSLHHNPRKGAIPILIITLGQLGRNHHPLLQVMLVVVLSPLPNIRPCPPILPLHNLRHHCSQQEEAPRSPSHPLPNNNNNPSKMVLLLLPPRLQQPLLRPKLHLHTTCAPLRQGITVWRLCSRWVTGDH